MSIHVAEDEVEPSNDGPVRRKEKNKKENTTKRRYQNASTSKLTWELWSACI